MPRQQVYGKRSRAIYDPFAAFVSPQHRWTKDVQEAQVADVSEELSKLRVGGGSPVERRGNNRKALGERHVNTVMQAMVSTPAESKQRQRGRRKKAAGDSGNGGADEKQHTEVVVQELLKPVVSIRSAKESKVHYEDDSHEIDDIPLFCDGHGYESDDDATQTPEPLQQVHKQATQLSTPSISVSPPTPPPPDEYSEHCASLLELSLHSMTVFSEWVNQLSSHFSITKIAEASFGEVYRLSLLEQIPGLSSKDESVFKVIALQPPASTLPIEKKKRDVALKKVECMSKPDDVANEVKLLQRMSSIPGFTNFRDVRVIKGRPPQSFVKAFKAFNVTQKARKKELSNFPDPARKASYADDQLWAVIEMQDAGTDLERFVETGDCTSIWTVWDIFWQVVLSLAKGEEGAEFEHRDLHLGNICVRQASEQKQELNVKRKLNFTNLETTVIDYTISRALMPDDTIAFQDLATDTHLFEGDSTEEYQYDIYRYMRGALLLDDPYADAANRAEDLEQSEQSWQQYHPTTNLIWLHFVLYKLLEQLDWPSATRAPPRKQKAAYAEWKRANDLEHVLLRVQELLDPGGLCRNEMRSASELVGLALRECWLDVNDVVGDGGRESGLVEEFEALSLEADAGAEPDMTMAEPEVSRESGRTRRKQ